MTLTGGLAKGGDGGIRSGGGGGMGGAIFNQGALQLEGVTLVDNVARGGTSAGLGDAGGGGFRPGDDGAAGDPFRGGGGTGAVGDRWAAMALVPTAGCEAMVAAVA